MHVILKGVGEVVDVCVRSARLQQRIFESVLQFGAEVAQRLQINVALLLKHILEVSHVVLSEPAEKFWRHLTLMRPESRDDRIPCKRCPIIEISTTLFDGIHVLFVSQLCRLASA